MELIKFSDIKNKLQNALQEKLNSSPIPNEAGFSLIEGFMTLNLQEEIPNKVLFGGPWNCWKHIWSYLYFCSKSNFAGYPNMTDTRSDQTISSGGEKLQTTVTEASFESLKQDVIQLENDLTEAKNNFEKIRFDLITLLGVFVGV